MCRVSCAVLCLSGAAPAPGFFSMIQSLGAQMRPAEIEAAIMIMDRNNDGKVTLDEFQAWWKMRNPDMANAAAV